MVIDFGARHAASSVGCAAHDSDHPLDGLLTEGSADGLGALVLY